MEKHKLQGAIQQRRFEQSNQGTEQIGCPVCGTVTAILYNPLRGNGEADSKLPKTCPKCLAKFVVLHDAVNQ